MLRNATRRASSAPAPQKEARPLGHSVDVAALEEALGNSIGTTDARSPKHYHTLCRIRGSLMSAQMRVQPHVWIENWKGHVYVGCWWRPQLIPMSVLDPTKWHTTVLRAWLSPGVDVAPWMPGWNVLGQGIADAVLMPQRDPAGNILVWIPPPPWKRSWAFGCPKELHECVKLIGDYAESLIRSYDAGARIERTPMDQLHISWN